MTRFYFVILIILSFSFGNFGEAASKVKKQNSKSAKKNETKTKNFADNSINFLTIEELGRLDSLTRTRYIIAYREAIVELSKIQMILGSEVALLPNKKSGFIAALLGEDVFADENVFERGKSDFDRCIYGGNLQQYSRNGGANQCEKPTCGDALQNSWLAENKRQYSSNSISCNFATFGIQMCVTPGYNSTQSCNKKAEELRNRNRNQIHTLISKLNDDWMKKDLAERAKLLPDLIRYAYDPSVMGHLVQFYTDAQENRKLSEYPELKSLSDYNETIRDLKSHYANITEHCNKKLSDSAIASFEGDRGPLANKRRSNLKQTKSKNLTPTVGNSLQRDECIVMLGDYNAENGLFANNGALARMEQGVDDALGNYTRVRTPPEVNTPPADTTPTTTAAEEPVDASNSKQRSVACDIATDMLKDRGMQCAKCLAQHSLDYRDSNNYLDKNKVSEKWLSLLSTMSHQCDGIKQNSQELTERALNYVQAFGTCGTNIYDFNEQDQKLKSDIQNWQSGKFNETDSKSKFEKVYGVSLSEAKRLFCNKPDGGFWGGQRWSEKYTSDNESRRWAQRRWMMYKRHGVLHDTNHGHIPMDGATPSLYAQSDIGKCIQSIYLREGTDGSLSDTSKESRGRCQGFENIASSFDKAVNQMFLGKPVVAVERDGNCFVGHSAWKTNNDSPFQISFVDPQLPDGQQPVLVSKKDGKVSFQPDRTDLVKFSVVDTSKSSYCPDDRGRVNWNIPSTSGGSSLDEMRRKSTNGAQ